MLRLTRDVIPALSALVALAVLVSDVACSLVLWQECLVKAGAFAVLYGALILTPWFRGGLAELKGNR